MLCHRVAIINRGRIIAVDSPAKLRQRLRGSSTLRAELQGNPGAIETALKQLPGIERVGVRGERDGFTTFEIETQSDADVREAIFRLAVAERWGLRELSSHGASLEDVFIQLTTQEPTA